MQIRNEITSENISIHLKYLIDQNAKLTEQMVKLEDRLADKVDKLNDKIDALNKKFVTKEEYEPLKKIVYGVVLLIFASAITLITGALL